MLTAGGDAVDVGRLRAPDLRQSLARIAEALEPDPELVQHRKIHAAHLAIGLAALVENMAEKR